MESALIGIVLATIGQLTVVYVVLATSISFNNTYDAEEENKEGEGQNHSNEPAGSGNAIVVLGFDHDI